MRHTLKHYAELLGMIFLCSIVWLSFTSIWAPPAPAQGQNTRIVFVETTPAGACSSKYLPLQYQVNTGGLYGCVSGTWTAIGGGGGGSTTFSQLGCSVTRTSATRLTIFSDATSTTPCVVRSINSVYRFTSPATVDISAGTSTGYIYVTSSGVLAVGHNGLTLTCTGCTAVAATTAFPTTVATLFQWDGSSGTWATTGLDGRAFANAFPWVGSTGLTCTISSGVQTCTIDGTVVVQKFTGSGAPGTISASIAGDIYTDTATGGLYGCKATPCTSGDWVAAGGGSSGINIFLKETSATGTLTGSDTTIYTTSVPALGAGKCADVKFGVDFTVNNGVVKLKFGAAGTIATAALGDSTPFKFFVQVCNIEGSQTSQRSNTILPMLFTADGSWTPGFNSTPQTFSETWSSAVTLKIDVNNSSGGTAVGDYLSIMAP